ncbi:MAB_1171c family putative transporter [Streptomyces jumonjinensis]|uniref:MAB_1171c family putative transporter n=1 Tax=Streptomyces jumonjinensis TaxID=1945 RepID=UPI0037AD0320
MRNSDYYIPAIALGIAFAAKLPALRRGRHDPLVRSVLFLLFTAAVCFVFAAPPTIAAVNRATGVPNISAPLVYCLMLAFSCACLVLIVNWRGGPRERVRRHSRTWIAVYGTGIAALPVLFALGEAPRERLRDLDTYYATTPFIREMIVLYLLAHIVSGVVTTAMCVRWARAVAHWLRVGLIVLVAGMVFNLAFGVAKLTAVVARWTGRDWDLLSTSVAPPLAAVGGMVLTVGFLLPLVGPRCGAVRRALLSYTRLGALWRYLRAAPGAHAPLPRIPWWASAELRLTVRETVIHDELLRLQPYLDDRVRARAHGEALGGAAPLGQARFVGVAAMVVAAVAARSGGQRPGDDEEHVQAGADALTAALTPGRERLVRLSRALGSPSLLEALGRQPAGRAAARQGFRWANRVNPRRPADRTGGPGPAGSTAATSANPAGAGEAPAGRAPGSSPGGAARTAEFRGSDNGPRPGAPPESPAPAPAQNAETSTR